MTSPPAVEKHLAGATALKRHSGQTRLPETPDAKKCTRTLVSTARLGGQKRFLPGPAQQELAGGHDRRSSCKATQGQIRLPPSGFGICGFAGPGFRTVRSERTTVRGHRCRSAPMSGNRFGMRLPIESSAWHALCSIVIEVPDLSSKENSHEIRKHHVERPFRQLPGDLRSGAGQHASVMSPAIQPPG